MLGLGMHWGLCFREQVRLPCELPGRHVDVSRRLDQEGDCKMTPKEEILGSWPSHPCHRQDPRGRKGEAGRLLQPLGLPGAAWACAGAVGPRPAALRSAAS